MSEEDRLCELATVSLHVSDLETDPGLDNSSKHDNQINICEGGRLYNGTVHGESSTKPVLKFVGSSTDSSDLGKAKLCAEHKCELQLYCSTEGKLTCSQCVSDGFCQGHAVTELVTRATVVRVSRDHSR